MDDVIYLGLFIAMMVLTFAYVALCDRIVGDADASQGVSERGRLDDLEAV